MWGERGGLSRLWPTLGCSRSAVSEEALGALLIFAAFLRNAFSERIELSAA